MSAVIAILGSAPALAKVVDFGLYVADVPPNWKIHERDKIVTLVGPERDCVFIITDGLSVSAHQKKVAGIVREYADVFKANPKQNVTVTRIHGVRVVATILGDNQARVPLFHSIKLKDENEAVPYR